MLSLPPTDGGPVAVVARFDLHDINQIDDDAETFEFSGLMTLEWNDPRRAFDPGPEGARERVYTGDFQFNEISPGWYPLMVLVNESATLERGGVSLRVRPDGACTMVQTINAVAKTDLNMRTYPFDRHRLKAVFGVLGFGPGSVSLVPAASKDESSLGGGLTVPQWDVTGVGLMTDSSATRAQIAARMSMIVLQVDVRRQAFFILRLVVLPLALIVCLSFAVFWMDRSSLGDRISVSFIGILTGVTYQLVMSQSMPQISYPTLMHAFLYLSFLTMCATVVINLAVGTLDKAKRYESGDRVDYACRWIFPTAYLSVLVVLASVAVFISFRAHPVSG